MGENCCQYLENDFVSHFWINTAFRMSMIERKCTDCGYKYTRPFMINRVWGLKLRLQMNDHV